MGNSGFPLYTVISRTNWCQEFLRNFIDGFLLLLLEETWWYISGRDEYSFLFITREFLSFPGGLLRVSSSFGFDCKARKLGPLISKFQMTREPKSVLRKLVDIYMPCLLFVRTRPDTLLFLLPEQMGIGEMQGQRHWCTLKSAQNAKKSWRRHTNGAMDRHCLLLSCE